MYADEGLVVEMDSGGTIEKTYGWKPNSTWGTNPVFMTEPATEGKDYFFYHNDHLGTPQKMTDASGTVVWSAKYKAFGEAVIDPASTIENNLRYPGQYFDAETGEHYNYHRTFDPISGRYTSADPIGLNGGINLFLYTNNNSVHSYDYNGLFSTEEAILHYFVGGGSTVVVDFREVDIGLQARDFPDFDQAVKSMYKKVGSRYVMLPSKSYDIGGWAGHQTYYLFGTIRSDQCEWQFDGYVRARHNPFDFDSKDWGSRRMKRKL
ncbi:MAG TPA: RHS repeat-associated core domain-containing protein [Nitrospirota bacterium]